MENLSQKLARFRPFRAAVIGDFMLDELIHGAAERLSPDAPVPVLHAQRFDRSPGGAANVARCIRALGGFVNCLGVVGDDPEGRLLRDSLEKNGCDCDGIAVDRERPTTVKRSLVGLAQHRHPQKMFRVDVESREPISESICSAMFSLLDRIINDLDVVCIEDYGKGVCCEKVCRKVIDLCRDRGKPVLVDPASLDDYSKYAGATAITPNRSEAERATHLDEPLESSDEHNRAIARRLVNALDLEAVVVTLDKSGAILALSDGSIEAIPTRARTVYDVTGAGDVVLAALAAGVANNLGWIDTVRFANAAAGLEVEVFGAQPITLAQVRQSVLSETRGAGNKQRSMNDLLIELDVHRDLGHRIVLTNGCFDVIHAGHVAYLREAKRLGDVLIVAVNSDDQVRAQKGEGRPVYSERERLEILGELMCIDYVVVFDEPTAHAVIEAVRPTVYVKGGDYSLEDINEFDLVQKLVKDGEMEFRTVAERPGLSSSSVIQKLQQT